MNPRERLQTALNHREPDRVPIDLGATPVTSISAVAYARLKRYLGIDDEPVRVADILLQLAEVEEPVRRRFGVDVVGLPVLEPLPGVRNTRWKPWRLPNGTPAFISADFEPEVTPRGDLLIRAADSSVSHWMAAGTYHFVPKEAPLARASREDLERWMPPRISDEELDFLHRAARRLYEETDYALFGWFGGSLFEGAQFARGWVQWMRDLKHDPGFAAALVEKLYQAARENLERYLDAVGEYVDVVGFGDDFGTQQGLQISPDLYRRLFQPYHRELYGLVHARTRARVFLHSCGAIHDLIPDLIEAGVDILNPVQTSAAKMEPERLKREFGDRLVFWGGACDPQGALSRGTPEEVAAEVRRRLEIFAPGGGYIFAPIHDLQHDVPPENIVAMYDAALRFRLSV
ncbi:MAG: methyltransferase [Anaerolineae bacterium]|nr:methyltransferase [Anaerolineae bacterium]